MIAQLLWKPFHVRYSDFLSRLSFHRLVLSDERHQIHISLAARTLEQQEEAKLRNDAYQRDLHTYLEQIRSMMSFHASKSDFGQYGGLCPAGTRGVILVDLLSMTRKVIRNSTKLDSPSRIPVN